MGYQVNFINALIMAVLLVVAFTTSAWLRRSKPSSKATYSKVPSHPTPDTEMVAITFDPTKPSMEKSQSGSIGNKRESSIMFGSKPAQVIGIRFRDLNFTIEDEVILPNLCGTIQACKINAILGPTGCGKSTLLNLLKAGGQRATSGEVIVTIKDVETEQTWKLDSHLRDRFVGYVPQEDIFERELTVRELLTFFMKCRARQHISAEEIDKEVTRVLDELSIGHIAESIIGGGENRPANISGGQLKRVNIACELVGLPRPSLLLLDEVTAGLDAAIALDLMKSLEKICHSGVTIVMVLQQPRVEIFSRIHHLFLMNQRGGIIYEGSSADAASYLHNLGYHQGEETSDADFCLDVLNHVIAGTDPTVQPWTLHTHWQILHGDSRDVADDHRKDQQDDLPAMEEAMRQDHKITQSLKVFALASAMINLEVPWWEKEAREIWLNAQRLVVVRTRNTTALAIHATIGVVMACALSSGFSVLIADSYLSTLSPSVSATLQAYFPSPLTSLSSWNPGGMGLEQLMFFMSSALGSASCLAAVPVFAGQVPIGRRERLSGLSPVAFVTGRLFADLLFVILNAFVFTGIWCLFGHAGSYHDWIAVILATAFASSAIGYISSAIVRKNSASVFAIIGTFFFCVFAGVEPTLRQVSIYPVVSWPWILSYATWTAEATYATWAKYLTNGDLVDIDIQDGAEKYGYVVEDGVGRAVGVLIALGVAWRVLAAILFVRQTRL